MRELNGLNKNLNEQLDILEEIILQNNILKQILEKLQKSNIKNYYVAAGCVNQTIFNYYHNYDLVYGIKDIDIVYFDEDLSYEKEDKIIKEIKLLLSNINLEIDIKNQARVHLWYEDKFGSKIKPYTSVEDAISKWGTTVTCIGVRLEKNKLTVYAPYGLNDLFKLTIRPVKDSYKKSQYLIKTKKWQEKWPMLTIIPWDD